MDLKWAVVMRARMVRFPHSCIAGTNRRGPHVPRRRHSQVCMPVLYSAADIIRCLRCVAIQYIAKHSAVADLC